MKATSRWRMAGAAVLVGAVLVAAPSGDIGWQRAQAQEVAPPLPLGTAFVALQLNLCNSGEAACYARYNNGRSVAEAAAVIADRRPDVVTLNEVCRSDVTDGLHPALARNFPGERTFAEFLPAGDPANGGRPYRCRNGEEYGIGVIGRVPAATANVPIRVFKGRYPQQDPGSGELRVWLCVAAPASYAACTTHLAATSAPLAMRQCRHLLNVEVPAMRAAIGARVPVVVAGDLNLRYGGSPNAQGCVPRGWFRRGDGHVQHFMATGNLTIGSGTRVDLRHTDHRGWQVAVEP